MSSGELSIMCLPLLATVDGQGHTDQGLLSPVSHARGWVVRMRTVRNKLTREPATHGRGLRK